MKLKEILGKVANYGAYDGDPRRDCLSVDEGLEAIKQDLMGIIGKDETVDDNFQSNKLPKKQGKNELRTELRKALEEYTK